MNIVRSASHVTQRGPADWFTGTVWLNEFTAGPKPPGVRITRVTFEPGARTAWHTHPHGQTLHIMAGIGRVQRAGEPAVDVFPGDTIWFEPGERHWHGAAPNSLLTHLAVQQADAEGNATTWLEPVSEADYLGRTS